MDILYIVMPAYNEEDGIEAVVRQWYPVLEGKGEMSRLVVADSFSTDGTNDILRKLKDTEFPKLEILSETGQFHGPKVIALYDYAIKSGADYIFQTDADGQTNPSEFDSFWNERMDYDGIFGNRTVRGDGRDRAFIERIVCILLKAYFGVDIPDANAPFRLMKAEVLKKYLYRMEPDYSLPNIMITTFFSYFGEKTAFKVISFKPRQAGTKSKSIRKIVKIGIRSLDEFGTFRSKMEAEKRK